MPELSYSEAFVQLNGVASASVRQLYGVIQKMTWTTWRKEPPFSQYDLNSPSGRTWNPEDGLELFSEGGGSGGFTKFRIEGPGVSIGFVASSTMAPITDQERKEINVPDAKVWCVYAGIPDDEKKKKIIVEALQAYKWGHGFSPRHNPVFVRFGKKEKIYNV